MSLSKQIAMLVRSLEVVSDVNIEFTVIQTILELIPVLLEECREIVYGIYQGTLPSDVAVQVNTMGRYVRFQQYGMIHTETVHFHEKMMVLYFVPHYMEFDLISLSFLPLHVNTDGSCVVIHSTSVLYAVSMEGLFFEYSEKVCTFYGRYPVCDEIGLSCVNDR